MLSSLALRNLFGCTYSFQNVAEIDWHCRKENPYIGSTVLQLGRNKLGLIRFTRALVGIKGAFRTASITLPSGALDSAKSGDGIVARRAHNKSRF